MLKKSLLVKLSLISLVPSLSWLAIPYFFEKFMSSLISFSSWRQVSQWGGVVFLLVLLAMLTEFLRYRAFSTTKISGEKQQSTISKLSLERIWALQIPTMLSSLFLLIGGIFLLLLRDYKLFVITLLWQVVTLYVQHLLTMKSATLGKRMRKIDLSENEALSLQKSLMGIQVVGQGFSNLFRTMGQILIFSVTFYIVQSGTTQDLKAQLPTILANLEYIGMTFGAYQVLASSMASFQEFRSYSQGGDLGTHLGQSCSN